MFVGSGGRRRGGALGTLLRGEGGAAVAAAQRSGRPVFPDKFPACVRASARTRKSRGGGAGQGEPALLRSCTLLGSCILHRLLQGAVSHSDMDTNGEARALSRDDLELARRWRAFLSGGEAPAAAGDTDADTALAAHIVVVWREIKARAHMYRCVESLAFLRASARRLPGYAALLARARDRGAAFRVLDVGCAFGQETRALILDGVPPSCCAVADVTRAYWDAGLAVFGDTASDASPLQSIASAFGDWAAPEAPADIAAPFVGTLDAALCMLVLHVLSADQQRDMLARLARCARPGGLLLGACVGTRSRARAWRATPDGRAARWLNNKETLAEALRAAGWDGEVEVTEAPATLWPMMSAPAPSSDTDTEEIDHARLVWLATKAAPGM